MNSKEHIKSIILGLCTHQYRFDILGLELYTRPHNVTNSDSSKKNEPKPLSKPMTASMEGTVTPFQIIHSKDDKPQGTVSTGDALDSITKPLKNQEVKSVSHMRRDHNLVIPELSNDFTVLDFTYDLPLTTYLSQVLNIDANVPNHFNFNRLLIDQDNDNHVVLYAISKDRHEVVKLKHQHKVKI